MGGSNQSKSAYNQSRAQQNWEQQQYTNMAQPNGAFSQMKPISNTGNNLLGLGSNTYAQAPSKVDQDQNNALSSIGNYTDASQKQAENAVASEYSNLQDQLDRNRVSQGGYMPGFGASSEDLVRNEAQQIANAAESPEMQAAQLYNSQYNTNAANAMQLAGLGLSGAQTGANLATLPFQNQLQALGLTEGDVNNLIGQQGNIGSHIASPFQQITGYMNSAAQMAAGLGGA